MDAPDPNALSSDGTSNMEVALNCSPEGSSLVSSSASSPGWTPPSPPRTASSFPPSLESDQYVVHTITQRLIYLVNSDPSNRACADCRRPLINRSQIYVSFHSDPFAGIRFHKFSVNNHNRRLSFSDIASENDSAEAVEAVSENLSDITPAPSVDSSIGASSSNGVAVGDATRGSIGSLASLSSAKTEKIRNISGKSTFLTSPSVAERNERLASMASGDNGFGTRSDLLGSGHRQPVHGYMDFRKVHAAAQPPTSTTNGAVISNTKRLLSEKKRRSILMRRVVDYTKGNTVFGVFICRDCAAAHRTLGIHVTIVKCVMHVFGEGCFTVEDVIIMEAGGGNARAKHFLERYITADWKARMPHHGSTFEERQLYARAKYEAYAFVIPSGPEDRSNWWNFLGQHSWNAIVSNPPLRSEEYYSTKSSPNKLPTRLVDYFCVVGVPNLINVRRYVNDKARERMTPDEVSVILSRDPESLRFEAKVLDCFPDQLTHSDTTLPTHLAKFVFPNGCQPSVVDRSPSFFSFVLTMESGTKLYGGALQIYDELLTSQEFLQRVADASTEQSLSKFNDSVNDRNAKIELENNVESLLKLGTSLSSLSSLESHPEWLLLPKCLVLLSHYGFFDVWQKFLQQLYRISLAEAPLPIERYISNFVREVPLPPKGRVEVKFCLTDEISVSIVRPPDNRLPLAGFSYRPLFTCLSVTNVIVVMGCLLQEDRVVICAKHVALLASVSEALVSLLFPLIWQGCYIPVMPDSMLDVLDAPVPFLVGIHSQYLRRIKPLYRPRGVVFVDLDDDVVHLGFEDSKEGEFGRPTPALPEKEAAKLKTSLEDHGGVAYLSTSSGRKGRITFGNDEDMENGLREAYAQETTVVWATEGKHQPILSGLVRSSVMSKVDNAYPNDEHLIPVKSFLTDKGTILQRDIAKSTNKSVITRLKLHKRKGKSEDEREATPRASEHLTKSLLDRTADESNGFSAIQVRASFLRFFVSIFRNYGKFVNSCHDDDIFAKEEFVKKSDHLHEGCHEFIYKMLASQMFERFIEERNTNLDQCEIKFFDESIVAKKNRSTKSTLLHVGKKRETPFLSNDADAVEDVYSPPPPSNWGLPDDDRVYHYTGFPSLDGGLFGKTRAAKQWDQDLYQRWVASPSLMNRKHFHDLVVSSDKSAMPEKDVVWAIHVLAYTFSSRDKGEKVDDRNPLVESAGDESTNAVKKMVHLALGLLSTARWQRNKCMALVSKPQALVRMHIVLSRYALVRRTVVYLQGFVRKVLLVKKYGRGVSRLFLKASDIQRTYRGYTDRKAAQAQQISAKTCQVIVRGWLARCSLRNLKISVIAVQATMRGRNIRSAYQLIRLLISTAQGRVRGYLMRTKMELLLRYRLKLYRGQIFDLWRRACTPLAYRAKFWTSVYGTGFAQLAVHEEELVKLWRELGQKPLERNDAVTYASLGSSRFDSERGVAQQIGSLSEKLGSKSAAVYQRVLIVKKKLDSQKKSASLKLDPVFPCEVGAAHAKMSKKSILKGRKEAMLTASRQLAVERAEVYEKLKFSTGKATLEDMFSSFRIPQASKKKKQALVERLWEDPHYVEASCHVLSSTKIVPSDYKMSKRARRVFHVDRGISHPISRAIDQRATEYLQDKLQSRLDKTVIETVFSCFIALQMQAEKNDARNNRSKFAGTDRVWFDQRAIVIGNYLACGEQTTFLEFARSRKLSRKNGESESPTEHVSTESDSVQREPSTKERSLRKERKANSTMKSTPKLEQTSKANMTNAVSSPKTSKQTNFGNAGKEDSFEMLHDDSPTRVTWSF